MDRVAREFLKEVTLEQGTREGLAEEVTMSDSHKDRAASASKDQRLGWWEEYP